MLTFLAWYKDMDCSQPLYHFVITVQLFFEIEVNIAAEKWAGLFIGPQQLMKIDYRKINRWLASIDISQSMINQ